MTCKDCGDDCQGARCQQCAFMDSRGGDARQRITGSYRTDGNGQSLRASLEDSINTHADETLAALAKLDPETGEYPNLDDAEYHARQLLQCVIGLKEVSP